MEMYVCIYKYNYNYNYAYTYIHIYIYIYIYTLVSIPGEAELQRELAALRLWAELARGEGARAESLGRLGVRLQARRAALLGLAVEGLETLERLAPPADVRLEAAAPAALRARAYILHIYIYIHTYIYIYLYLFIYLCVYIYI